MFLVKSRSTEGINVIRLSGDMQSFYVYPNENRIELLKLLNGEVPEIPWDDFTYELPGKEVVIPVKNNSGQVIGAIVRGVIEEKSF
jgi:hypothetical protein